GAGSVHFVEGNMEAGQYVRILEEHLKTDGQKLCGSNFVFQADNDPKHTSRIAQAWIRRNRIKTVEWPSNSPDMNPIEHLFHLLKANLRKRYISTVDGLKAAIVEEWESVGSEYCASLVDSMPSRLDALGKAKGGHTEY
ncbi:MAG: putative Transposable element Tcb1 transposase, partial [Streblomastix strix]